MSAFIVEPNTINRIVTFMANDRHNQHRFEKFRKSFHVDPHDSPEAKQIVGSLLLTLNIRAVNKRYADTQTVEFYWFAWEQVPPIQAYKSLRCWLYQCAEGTVPQSELFLLMSEYQGCVAENIVSQLPEFETAAWG